MTVEMIIVEMKSPRTSSDGREHYDLVIMDADFASEWKKWKEGKSRLQIGRRIKQLHKDYFMFYRVWDSVHSNCEGRSWYDASVREVKAGLKLRVGDKATFDFIIAKDGDDYFATNYMRLVV